MVAGNNNNNVQAMYQAQYSSMFLGAPLSKLVTALIVIAYVSISSKRASSVFDFNAARIRERGENYRYTSSQLTFTSTSELLMGTILVSFLLRKFEREMGSRKMVFFCLFVYVATIAVEVFLVASADGWNTAYAVAIGWFAALLYEILPFLTKLDVPDFLADFLGDISSRLLEAPPRLLVPQPVRGGAGTGTGGRAFQRVPAVAAAGGVRQTAAAQRPSVAPDPAVVEQLTMMGFSRTQVVEALRSSNNDVQRAADRLLTQQSS